MSSVTPFSVPTLRRAIPADAAALATFATRCFRQTYAPPHGPCDPADVEAYVADHFGPAVQAAELVDPRTRVVLAEAGGTIVGYAHVRTDTRPTDVPDYVPVLEPGAEAILPGATAELARLYVDRPWHGAGVAALLFDAARALAAESGAASLWLSAYQRNPRALAFYRKHGARAFATATFRMGQEVQDDWLLAVPTAAEA